MAYPVVYWSRDTGGDQRVFFEAENGEHGNFSYVDVAKYGTRGYKAGLIIPTLGSGIGVSSIGSKLVLPGGGGGARPLPTYKRGSNSPGYSPNGIVLIRLVRINPA